MTPGVPKTRVVFRRDNDGTIFALFPEIPASVEGPQFCLSYTHIGQHSAANYDYCIQKSQAAKPQEYADLFKELSQRGYNVEITQRAKAELHVTRQKTWEAEMKTPPENPQATPAIPPATGQQRIIPVPPPATPTTDEFRVQVMPHVDLQWLCVNCMNTCVATDVMTTQDVQCPRCGQGFTIRPEYPYVEKTAR